MYIMFEDRFHDLVDVEQALYIGATFKNNIGC